MKMPTIYQQLCKRYCRSLNTYKYHLDLCLRLHKQASTIILVMICANSYVHPALLLTYHVDHEPDAVEKAAQRELAGANYARSMMNTWRIQTDRSDVIWCIGVSHATLRGTAIASSGAHVGLQPTSRMTVERSPRYSLAVELAKRFRCGLVLAGDSLTKRSSFDRMARRSQLERAHCLLLADKPF